MTRFTTLLAAGFVFAFLPACVHSGSTAREAESGEEDIDDVLAAMMRGESFLQGAELDDAIAEAGKHPLGSERNPVRVSGPRGQTAYLGRLKCPSGDPPAFFRIGSVGTSVFGNIADLYSVTCEGAEPYTTQVYMDMYHTGHVEDRPIPGFTILPPGGDAQPA